MPQTPSDRSGAQLAPLSWQKRIGWTLISLAVLIAVWALAAAVAHHRHGPGPLTVLDALIHEARSGRLFVSLAATLARVAVSFTVAMVIGSMIGLALGRNETANRFFDVWLILFLNLPALVIIALCYVCGWGRGRRRQ